MRCTEHLPAVMPPAGSLRSQAGATPGLGAGDRGRSLKYMAFRNLLLFLLLAASSAMAQEPQASPALTKDIAQDIKAFTFPEVEYPVPGMKMEELINTLQEVATLIDAETTILEIRFLGLNRLEVFTGKRTAPLDGQGLHILFERKEEKWIETKRNPWVS